MGREIIFRGRSLETGLFVIGCFNNNSMTADAEIIIWDTQTMGIKQIMVDPETVGQFTGIKDKNGDLIFEGDTVKFHYFYGTKGEGMGFVEAEHELTGIVEWGVFGWGITAIKGEHWQGYTGYDAGEGKASFISLCAMSESAVHEESFEIIGNKYY